MSLRVKDELCAALLELQVAVFHHVAYLVGTGIFSLKSPCFGAFFLLE